MEQPDQTREGREAQDASLELFTRLARQISNGVNFSAIAANIVQAASELSGAAGASFMVVEEDAGKLFVREGHNIDRRYTADQQVPWGNRLVDLLTVAARPLITPDIAAGEPSPFRDFAAAVGFSSYYGQPVRSGGATAGLLNLYWSDPGHQLSNRQEAEMAALGALAALLIDKSNLSKAEEVTQRKQQVFERYKSEYASLVSHELRTPLTSIKGFAQLIVRQQNSNSGAANVGRHAGTILSETNRMSDLITNMTDLAQMETTMVGVRVQAISVNNMVQECLMELQASGVDPQFRLEVPSDLPICEGDRGQLRHLLIDLLARLAKIEGNLRLTAFPQREDDSDLISAVTICCDLDAAAAAAGGMPSDLGGLTLRQAMASVLGSNEKLLYVTKNLLEVMGGSLTAELVGDPIRLRYGLTLPTLKNRLATSLAKQAG